MAVQGSVARNKERNLITGRIRGNSKKKKLFQKDLEHLEFHEETIAKGN